MDLARDLLDKQLVNKKGEPLGRVDSIVIELRPGAPPIVAAFEVGFPSLMHRIHPAFGRWARKLAPRLGFSLKPVTIPIEVVKEIDIDIEIDPDEATFNRLLAIEHWLRCHVIERIPGGSG